MAKDPAFLFYSSDFLTGTMFMTYEQIGLYIKMLCIQHQHGGRIDTNVLRSQCDSITNGDTVFAKFVHDERGSYSERLDLEMQKRAAKSVKATESVKKRWNKPSYERNTNVIRSENENVNENKDITKDKIEQPVKNKKEKVERSKVTSLEGYNIPDDWKPAMQYWLDYKKERKEYYSGEKGLMGAFSTLKHLCGNNSKHSVTLVKAICGKNWAGMYWPYNSSHPEGDLKFLDQEANTGAPKIKFLTHGDEGLKA